LPAADPKTRSTLARLAALERWSQEDPTVNAVRGQAGLRAKFLRQVTADAAARGETPNDAELSRRADCAYRAHMIRVRHARRTPDGTAA